MAKAPPSFDLYPGDVLKTTAGMSAEVFGAYMRLMFYQWEHGFIPELSDERMLTCGIMDHERWNAIWSRLSWRFACLCEDGKLGDEDMDVKRNKAIATWNARKLGGFKGGRPLKNNLDVSVENLKGLLEKPPGKREEGRGKKGLGRGVGKPKGRFVPPTLEQVSEYVLEIRKAISPQVFVDHYTSNGWKVGPNLMRDWRAAVRKWKDEPKLMTMPLAKLWDDEDTDTETGRVGK